jgi:hypothetical protein
MRPTTILKWQTGDIYRGVTAYYLDRLESGKYSISEASPMAMDHYERLGLYTDLSTAVAVFGKLTAVRPAKSA